jgi:hypothetical protein
MPKGKLFIIVAIAATLGVAGCSSSTTEPDTSTTTAPSAADRPEMLAQCLRDAGYPDVVIQEDGGVGVGLPEEQAPLFAAASEECNETLGFNDAALTDEEMSDLYDASVDGATCLEDEGFSISKAPSRETFSESSSETQWFPWGEVPREQLGSALEACPQPQL